MAVINLIAFLYFTVAFFPLAKSLNNSDSLEALLEDFALKAIVKNRSHTGVLFKAVPPRNLSGIEVSVLRIRSRGLWNKGANFGQFNIPPRTTSLPHVRRLALVYQDLGNWSSKLYNVQGYNLITSVVGFMAFDVSNYSANRVRNVTLRMMGNPISIRFHDLNLSESSKSDTRCVTFVANGTSYLSEMSSPGLCHSREEGHFSVVVQESKLASKRKQRLWHWWLSGFVLGFATLVVMGFAGLVFVRLLRTKKIQIMERQADEDSSLSSRWVGQSKMPSAEGTRTMPSLDNGCFT